MIKRNTFELIISQYYPVPPEQGGILGMKDGVICEYIHDNSIPEMDKAIYVPDTAFLNGCIERWSKDGIDFCGIIHSHPKGQKELSSGDLEYIEKLYRNNPHLKTMYFPLMAGDHGMVVYVTDMVDGRIMVRKSVVQIIE